MFINVPQISSPFVSQFPNFSTSCSKSYKNTLKIVILTNNLYSTQHDLPISKTLHIKEHF